MKAVDILRLINASNKPYSGAFCNFKGEKVIIWDATVVIDNEIFCAVPGQITKITSKFIDVACGAGKIRIFNVGYRNQLLSPSELIKSTRARLE